jgi:hypothetical protein
MPHGRLEGRVLPGSPWRINQCAAWATHPQPLDLATLLGRMRGPVTKNIRKDMGSIAKTPYAEWEPTAVADPRAATVPQLVNGMEKITAAEGPVLEDRLYSIYARAGELGRIYDHTRRRFTTALDYAIREGILLVETETFGDQEERVVRLPDQPPVVVRTRGSRTLHEVPASELAEVMMEVRVSHDLISREELFRSVLEEYGLKRLTQATEQRLTDVFRTWLA